MSDQKPTKDQLLTACYEQEREITYIQGSRGFDCLIAIIEYGTVTTWEELKEYGVEVSK